MLTILAHVTEREFPWGAALFFAGALAGSLVTAAVLRRFRSR